MDTKADNARLKQKMTKSTTTAPCVVAAGLWHALCGERVGQRRECRTDALPEAVHGSDHAGCASVGLGRRVHDRQAR